MVAEDEVLRLDVAVHDLLLVDVLERLAALADEADGLVDPQSRRSALLEEHVEIDPLDELHDEVLAAVVAEVVEHLHDARMAEHGQQPRLDLEALRVAGVEQVLDRDPTRVAQVAGAVDCAHRPARDRRADLVSLAEHQAG